MGREYVAVLDGDGRGPDEIVKSCVASSRQIAERKINKSELYLVMTRRQAEARGIQDLREMTRSR